MTVAVINLHNFLMIENKSENKKITSENTYCPPNYVDTEDSIGNVMHSA